MPETMKLLGRIKYTKNKDENGKIVFRNHSEIAEVLLVH